MRVVSVMAHQDDELMCLGTMLKMKERGDSPVFICLTDGSTGMVHRPEMDRAQAAAVRETEMQALCAHIGAEYICLNLHDEYLYDTPDTRDALIAALRQARADVVFTHFATDYNLDHMTTNALVRQCAMQAAFPMIKTAHPPLKTAPAVFMTEPSGGFEFEPTHFVDISGFIEEKRHIAKFHKSQDDAFMEAFGYGIDAWISRTSAHRGAQTGVSHCEAFRPMLARGLIRAQAILP